MGYPGIFSTLRAVGMASFCFLSHQKSALRLLNRGQKMTQVIGKLARNLNNKWRGPQNLYSINLFYLRIYVTNPKRLH